MRGEKIMFTCIIPHEANSSLSKARDNMAAATAQTRPSNGVLVAGLGGYQMGGRPIVLRQLLLWW